MENEPEWRQSGNQTRCLIYLHMSDSRRSFPNKWYLFTTFYTKQVDQAFPFFLFFYMKIFFCSFYRGSLIESIVVTTVTVELMSPFSSPSRNWTDTSAETLNIHTRKKKKKKEWISGSNEQNKRRRSRKKCRKTGVNQNWIDKESNARKKKRKKNINKNLKFETFEYKDCLLVLFNTENNHILQWHK